MCVPSAPNPNTLPRRGSDIYGIAGRTFPDRDSERGFSRRLRLNRSHRHCETVPKPRHPHARPRHPPAHNHVIPAHAGIQKGRPTCRPHQPNHIRPLREARGTRTSAARTQGVPGKVRARRNHQTPTPPSRGEPSWSPYQPNNIPSPSRSEGDASQRSEIAGVCPTNQTPKTCISPRAKPTRRYDPVGANPRGRPTIPSRKQPKQPPPIKAHHSDQAHHSSDLTLMLHMY